MNKKYWVYKEYKSKVKFLKHKIRKSKRRRRRAKTQYEFEQASSDLAFYQCQLDYVKRNYVAW